MLWAMTILLLALWGLGLASGAALGSWVHLLVGFAMVTLALAVVQASARRGQASSQGGRGDARHTRIRGPSGAG